MLWFFLHVWIGWVDIDIWWEFHVSGIFRIIFTLVTRSTHTFLCDKTDVLNSLCLRLSDLWIHYKRHCYCVHLHEWRGWNTDEVYLCECRINPESLCFAIIIIEIVLNEKNNCHPTTSFQKLVCWIYRISPLMKHLNTIQHVSINMSEVLFVQ